MEKRGEGGDGEALCDWELRRGKSQILYGLMPRIIRLLDMGSCQVRYQMRRRRAEKRGTCVMKRIETSQYHLSAGYIFALRVVVDLPHNRALLPFCLSTNL